jgi:hypothetical protein
MKKGMIVILMGIIIAVYVFSIRERFTPVDTHSTDVAKELLSYKQQFQSNYPDTIEGVLDMHAQLMKLQYSKDMLPEYVEETVGVLRYLYSEALLELNSKEDQIEALFKETLETSVSGMYIIGSNIENVNFNEEAGEGTGTVKYYTTMIDFQREYELINEEKEWKIYAWRDSLLAEESPSKEE